MLKPYCDRDRRQLVMVSDSTTGEAAVTPVAVSSAETEAPPVSLVEGTLSNSEVDRGEAFKF